MRISRAGLVSAVAKTGALGTLAAVGLGEFETLKGSEYVEVNNKALREEIAKIRAATDRPFAVNLMRALTNYEEFARVCAEEKVAIIVSGAGLPLDLPKLVPEKEIRLVPIVSAVKAFAFIVKYWKTKFDRQPDAVIIEGPMAGGHLGYTYEYLKEDHPTSLMDTFTAIKKFLEEKGLAIPVIVGGGIFEGKEAVPFLKAGAAGVQMATRFVCTDECDADIKFKQEYLRAKKEDIVIIQSPVGMPGRVVKNAFVEKILAGERAKFSCRYQCLRTCEPKVTPYCIAKVLTDAANGKLEEAFAFAGSNAYKCKEIVSVQKMVDTFLGEVKEADPSLVS